MNFFSLFERKAAPPNASPVSHRGWLSILESFPGAWQRNVTISIDTTLTYSAVFRCISLISSDIGKLRVKLVRLTSDGVWEEADDPAFSPVLRKPNRYQTRIQFFANWVHSKLVHGNTYVLKERDARNVVTRLYILDPTRVTTLVAPDGSVYYGLRTDHLSGVRTETVTVPASEIIHDHMNEFFHPLVGISPISACSVAAAAGLAIQNSSAKLFQNGARPSGILTAPGQVSEDTARRLKESWDTNYGAGGPEFGKTAVLGDGLEYRSIAMTADDAQLVDQLKLTSETVASVFGIPYYMIGGPAPTYTNVEALILQYYSQCLQTHIESIEVLLDEGLGLGPGYGNPYGCEFDLDGLLRMDTKTLTEAASAAVKSSILAPNEARKRYFDLGPVKGGESPYAQQQLFSLASLAARDSNEPFSTPTPAPSAEPPAPTPAEEAEERRLRALRNATRRFYELADREYEHAQKLH